MAIFGSVDQVCIDQSNIAERNQQVSIMGQIYQKAEKVLICLGEVGWHAGPFLALVQEIGSLADRTTRIEKAQSMSMKRDNQSNLRQIGRPSGSITDDKWDPLYDIFRSPWFTRAWVFQECVLSTRAELMVGSRLVSFDTFYNVVEAIFPAQYERWGYDELGRSSAYVPVTTMYAKRRERPQTSRDFLTLLGGAMGDFNTTDPRDCVYAFLGLNPLVAPDYSMSVSEVYTAATRSFIEELQDLSVFGLSSGVTVSALAVDLPSWAVDWSGKGGYLPLFPPNQPIPFSASGRRKHQRMPTLSDLRQLTVRGKVIDQIDWIGKYEQGRKALMLPFEIMHSFDKVRKEVIKAFPKNADTASISRERVLKVLLVDQAWTPGSRKDVTTLLGIWDSWPKPMSNEHLHEAHQSGFDRVPPAEWNIRKGRSWYDRNKVARSVNRKLGLVPRAAKRGDHICILHGSNVPIVLRMAKGKDKKGQWQLVGQCCWEDVMYGEAVSWIEEEAETFVLAGNTF